MQGLEIGSAWVHFCLCRTCGHVCCCDSSPNRFNVTVTLALLVGALSVSGAIFLILELSTPYSGFMQISDAPLRHALTQISG